jgi:hypothetical protein
MLFGQVGLKKAAMGVSAAALMAALSFASPALADPCTGNICTISYGPGSNPANSSASVRVDDSSGMFDWSIDGRHELFQQWFWYRTGNNAEQSIDTIGLSSASISKSAGPFDNDVDTLNLLYKNATLQVSIRYQISSVLPSPSGGHSQIAEDIQITNLSGSTQSVAFFQYSDFDLGLTGLDDQAFFDGHNTIWQSDGDSNLSEGVVSPAAARYEINSRSALLGKLTDGDADDLASLTSSGLSPTFNLSSTQDTAWAYEWFFSLASGATSPNISKLKTLDWHEGNFETPEPASMSLIGFGLLGFAALRRRVKRSA